MAQVNQPKEKEPSSMHLGELVLKMINLTRTLDKKLIELGNEGSDFHSIEQLRESVHRDYEKAIAPYMAELAKYERADPLNQRIII
jgi:hypothetical protein